MKPLDRGEKKGERSFESKKKKKVFFEKEERVACRKVGRKTRWRSVVRLTREP